MLMSRLPCVSVELRTEMLDVAAPNGYKKGVNDRIERQKGD